MEAGRANNNANSKSKAKKASGHNFASLGLNDALCHTVYTKLGFRQPTPVQREAIPVILSGVDSVVMARTGSGKTCAFLLPVLQQLERSSTTTNRGGVRALILSPARELSLQTLKVLKSLLGSTNSSLRAIGIHGGEGMELQFSRLASRPDIIVATPGRLAHHVSEIADFSLTHVQMCVLDEADRLLEMGFLQQLKEIQSHLPERCQKLLLSATLPKVLVEFTQSGFCRDPHVVRLDQEATVSDQLRMAFITCRSLDKDALLLRIVQMIQQETTKTTTGLTLIFAATRHHVEYITTLLTASHISATMIYGTLDSAARQQNLARFRSGNCPVLVVTDVAARGIDVPLIDHVIHYHFPASPKLFVHRSGRAARAGRIGYCWGLVEPDEVPYLVDLHLFLGRHPTTSEAAYRLSDMTPDMVHYGSFPESIATTEVETVHRIFHSELSGSQEAQALKSLSRVCVNAMKQYKRTRSEASREGVRRAKAILEGERTVTGERLGKGAVPPHPLLRTLELQQHQQQLKNSNSKEGGVRTLENMQKRDDFLRAMSQFRPKETVFEAFATGKHKDSSGVVSHVDKGRTTTSNKKTDSSAALTAMKNMRRQMRMARDKGTTLVVAGTAETDSDWEADKGEDGMKKDLPVDQAPNKLQQPTDQSKFCTAQEVVTTKRRLSKAERKRLKRAGGSAGVAKPPFSGTKDDPETTERGFKDPAFYIDNGFGVPSQDAERSRRVEAAMQPSAASRGSMGAALRLEEAMLDIVGDENEDMIKKQRVMRWDKSKRKYIKSTVGEELSGMSKSKKLRLESGQLVKTNKLKLGELYEKWQKKTQRSVGRTGIFDEEDNDTEEAPSRYRKKKKHPGNRNNSEGKEQIKTSSDIRKERQKKQKLKVKNMKKGDRRRLENKGKSQQR